MDENKQPGINFDGIILKELNFSRNPTIPKKPNLNVDFEKSISLSPEKDKLVYELSCTIKDQHKSFGLKCSMVGIFSIIKDSINMDLEHFSKNNAPALIFPYIRETVASTTLKAGLPSVLLPPLNIHAIFNKELEE